LHTGEKSAFNRDKNPVRHNKVRSLGHERSYTVNLVNLALKIYIKKDNESRNSYTGKKVDGNSTSLTGFNRLTCKGDRKLF
jgi:hypothetical protein